MVVSQRQRCERMHDVWIVVCRCLAGKTTLGEGYLYLVWPCCATPLTTFLFWRYSRYGSSGYYGVQTRTSFGRVLQILTFLFVFIYLHNNNLCL